MKILNLVMIICLVILISSCNVMLRLSEFAIPLKEDQKIALLEKIQAEPDSLFVYIKNSKFYDEEYLHVNPDSEFIINVIKSMKECNEMSYFIISDDDVSLFDGDEFGALMQHSIFLVHDGTCLGLRLIFVRKGFQWYVWTISNIIPPYICYPHL
jgi:hypothetical protein